MREARERQAREHNLTMEVIQYLILLRHWAEEELGYIWVLVKMEAPAEEEVAGQVPPEVLVSNRVQHQEALATMEVRP